MLDRLRDLVAANRTLTIVTVLVVLLVVVPAVRVVAALVLRVMARLLLLLALIALVADGTRWMAGGESFAMTSFLDHWSALSPATRDATRQTLVTKLHPFVWDGVLARFLALPAWLVLALVAMLLAHIGRRRRQVRIYANA